MYIRNKYGLTNNPKSKGPTSKHIVVTIHKKISKQSKYQLKIFSILSCTNYRHLYYTNK